MYKQGATLLELVVVLACVLIMVMLGMQLVSGLGRMAARAELGLLALTIRTEQQKALLAHTERAVTFAADGMSYATATATHQFQPGVHLGAPPGSYGPPSSPQTPITKPLTFKNNRLLCYPQGIIQAGTVYLAAPAYNQFYALTSSVAQYSFVRLYHYRQNWMPL